MSLIPRPGEAVTVKRSAGGRWAGRSGLVVAADRERVLVRFGPVRAYEIPLVDLIPLTAATAARRK